MAVRSRRSILRPVRLRRSLVLALVAVTAAFGTVQLSTGAAPAAAAPLSLEQCNGHGPGALGATMAMTCTVVVVNSLGGSTQGSTTTPTRTCALGPCAPGNGTFVSSSTDLVTTIDQCNGSDNDAAHPIRCEVSVVNRIEAGTPGANPSPRRP